MARRTKAEIQADDARKAAEELERKKFASEEIARRRVWLAAAQNDLELGKAAAAQANWVASVLSQQVTRLEAEIVQAERIIEELQAVVAGSKKEEKKV